MRDVDKNLEDLTRAGPPSGGPVRSILKNHVLPGFSPADLHYGKNGYVLRSLPASRQL